MVWEKGIQSVLAGSGYDGSLCAHWLLQLGRALCFLVVCVSNMLSFCRFDCCSVCSFLLLYEDGRSEKHLPIVAGGVAIVCLILYFTVYDRGYYHIDTVREPMIRFLFMESMLLGAWFKQHDQEFRSRFKMWYPIATLGMFLVYFASKLLFSRRQSLAEFQILNQFAIFALLILVFMTFMGLDAKLEEMPQRLKKVIRFISSITLEIYLVQNVLIAMLRPIGHFPVNWVILTTCILAEAFLLHKVCEVIYKLVDIILEGGNL